MEISDSSDSNDNSESGQERGSSGKKEYKAVNEAVDNPSRSYDSKSNSTDFDFSKEPEPDGNNDDGAGQKSELSDDNDLNLPTDIPNEPPELSSPNADSSTQRDSLNSYSRDSGFPTDIPSLPEPLADKPNNSIPNNPKEQPLAGLDPKSPPTNIIDPKRSTSPSSGNLIDALIKFGAEFLGLDKSSSPTPEKSLKTTPSVYEPYAKIRGVVNNPNVTPEFIAKVETIAKNRNASAYDLMTAMSFETGGTFNPAEKNKAGSSGTGLIQFTKVVAEELGTSPEDLSKMSALEQLKYVDLYLEKKLSKNKVSDPKVTLENLYMSILRPIAVGKSPDTVIFKEGTKNYRLNKGLDTDKNKEITIREATDRVRRQVESLQKENSPKSKPKGLSKRNLK
jgi:hypothetical protein